MFVGRAFSPFPRKGIRPQAGISYSIYVSVYTVRAQINLRARLNPPRLPGFRESAHTPATGVYRSNEFKNKTKKNGELSK